MTEIVNNVKAHLEQGAQLLQEHIPELVGRALQLEGDPLVAAVQAAVLPPEARVLLADLVTKLASTYPAPPAPEPEPAPEPAESPAEPVPAG